MIKSYPDLILSTTDGPITIPTLVGAGLPANTSTYNPNSYISWILSPNQYTGYFTPVNNMIHMNQNVVNSTGLGATLQNNENVRVLTLSNGNYLNAHKNDNGSFVYFEFYTADNTRLGGFDIRTKSDQRGYSGLCVLYDDVKAKPYLCGCYWRTSYEMGGYILNAENFETWVTGSITPQYTWTAWDQISGNNGQYRCNLTMIKASSIGDFSQLYYGTESDMSRISGQADLMNIFHNMVYDQERTIAWSGENWMTLTLHTVTGLPNQAEFVFKFYVPSVSSSTPIYTQSFNVVWNGTYKAQHYYLSFVHDDGAQAALLAPVEHMYNGQYNWGYVSSVSETDMLYLWLWLQSSGSPAGDSPYSTGTTDNGGTPGGGMPQSHIDVPAPPTLGGTATGMFTVYCPTETQMAKISAFLWSADTITNIRKYFNNFSENIMAFYVLPCKPTNNPTKVFTVGNMSSSDTDLQSVEYISNRFIQIDMGDLIIEPFWDSYLDYAPYSKMEVYLPGIGVQPLDVDDIMCPALQDGSLPEATGSRLHIDYNIDLMTGVMVACISINGEMRYQFPGKMGYTIPLTGENYTRLVQGYVTATAGLIGTIATGGAAAPFAAGATAAGIINAMKPDIYRGGNLSGDSSMLSRKTPMLIYRRPNKAQLIDQEKYTGFPSYKIDLLSNFTGYTEVIDCHVEGISCTEEERDLILAALKGGVII